MSYQDNTILNPLHMDERNSEYNEDAECIPLYMLSNYELNLFLYLNMFHMPHNISYTFYYIKHILLADN